MVEFGRRAHASETQGLVLPQVPALSIHSLGPLFHSSQAYRGHRLLPVLSVFAVTIGSPPRTPPNTPTATFRVQHGGRRCTKPTQSGVDKEVLTQTGRISPRAHPRSVPPQQHRPPRRNNRRPRVLRLEEGKAARRVRCADSE